MFAGLKKEDEEIWWEYLMLGFIGKTTGFGPGGLERYTFLEKHFRYMFTGYTAPEEKIKMNYLVGIYPRETHLFDLPKIERPSISDKYLNIAREIWNDPEMKEKSRKGFIEAILTGRTIVQV